MSKCINVIRQELIRETEQKIRPKRIRWDWICWNPDAVDIIKAECERDYCSENLQLYKKYIKHLLRLRW